MPLYLQKKTPKKLEKVPYYRCSAFVFTEIYYSSTNDFAIFAGGDADLVPLGMEMPLDIFERSLVYSLSPH